ncbi:DgyrCDS790 [Dimorphilus gyrociliatus]|uniref:DgyrCDS790 n=1 Tax=Dimorphilus gyrociliatus TaxID=2664684 RepID=A0A7I8V5D9_9ANNE|nr:DgyrCDS790 [Dimorphilus gyrociliatus]
MAAKVDNKLKISLNPHPSVIAKNQLEDVLLKKEQFSIEKDRRSFLFDLQKKKFKVQQFEFNCNKVYEGKNVESIGHPSYAKPKNGERKPLHYPSRRPFSAGDLTGLNRSLYVSPTVRSARKLLEKRLAQKDKDRETIRKIVAGNTSASALLNYDASQPWLLLRPVSASPSVFVTQPPIETKFEIRAKSANVSKTRPSRKGSDDSNVSSRPRTAASKPLKMVRSWEGTKELRERVQEMKSEMHDIILNLTVTSNALEEEDRRERDDRLTMEAKLSAAGGDMERVRKRSVCYNNGLATGNRALQKRPGMKLKTALDKKSASRTTVERQMYLAAKAEYLETERRNSVYRDE